MERPNISTEHQPKGSARNQSDTLDRDERDKAQRPGDGSPEDDDIATKAGATEAPPIPDEGE